MKNEYNHSRKDDPWGTSENAEKKVSNKKTVRNHYDSDDSIDTNTLSALVGIDGKVEACSCYGDSESERCREPEPRQEMGPRELDELIY